MAMSSLNNYNGEKASSVSNVVVGRVHPHFYDSWWDRTKTAWHAEL